VANHLSSVEDKVVIVTGGTKGIGKAIAESFLEMKAKVIICARNEPDEDIASNGVSADFYKCDVRENNQISSVIEYVMTVHGRLDILVNNAGGAPPADSASASESFTRRVVELNLVAPLSFAQMSREAMLANDNGGVIINIASVSGMRANPLGVAYGAAKAGLLNATETLAVEWGPKIRVVSVTGGLILTEDSRAFYGDDESVEEIAKTIPMGRLGQPQDIADACLFAASDAARWMTGSNIVLHGGGEKPAYLAVTNPMEGNET
jgi:NAD(P)-dependent dehydrogenase (short-subunit alcohol dehydrogenase family)